MHFVALLYDILFNFVYKIAIIDGNCVEKKESFTYSFATNLNFYAGNAKIDSC